MFQSWLNNLLLAQNENRAGASTEYAPKQLQRILSTRRSGFGAYSVHAPAASAHTQCKPQLLWRILSTRQSFGHFLGSAAACTEYAPKPLRRGGQSYFGKRYSVKALR